MSALTLELRERCDRLGLKGPRAADWLVTQGVDVPATPNTWTQSEEAPAADALLVARLGTAEFFFGHKRTTVRTTPMTQNPPSERTCGFKSRPRHQNSLN